MTFYAQMRSPLGPILLSVHDSCLDGLYFVDQADCPAVGQTPIALGRMDPTAGTLSGLAIKDFRIHKAQSAGPGLFDDLAPLAGQTHRQGAPSIAIAPDAADAAPVPESSDTLAFMQADTPHDAAAVLEQARDELLEYFQGRRQTFTVPLHLDGTPFQKKVWRALLEIPYGEYVSYGDVAHAAGLTPGHGRPVGTAVGRNPITIIVPCHRVLASNGRLNGYSGGLERKLALLKIEGFTLR